MRALPCPVAARIEGSTATARFRLRAGDVVGFALHRANNWQARPPVSSQTEIDQRLDHTMEGWCSWSTLHQAYEGPWRELVHYSGRVLQALTFQPTAAIVAAPTTSLPERVGGERDLSEREVPHLAGWRNNGPPSALCRT